MQIRSCVTFFTIPNLTVFCTCQKQVLLWLFCFHLCERKTNSSLTVSGCARWPCRGWSFSSHWAMTSRRSSLQSKCRWVFGGGERERALCGRRECAYIDFACVARRDYFGVRSVACDMARAREMRGAARRFLFLFQQLMLTREIALQEEINWTCFVCFLLSATAQVVRMNEYLMTRRAFIISLCVSVAPFIDSADLVCVRCMFVSPRWWLKTFCRITSALWLCVFTFITAVYFLFTAVRQRDTHTPAPAVIISREVFRMPFCGSAH